MKVLCCGLKPHYESCNAKIDIALPYPETDSLGIKAKFMD